MSDLNSTEAVPQGSAINGDSTAYTTVGTARTFGLTTNRNGWAPRLEHFSNRLVKGLQDVLVGAGHTLLLRLVGDEDEHWRVWQHWARSGSVDAVVVHGDGYADQGTLSRVEELGLPFVLLGERVQQGWHDCTVTVDSAELLHVPLDHLVGRGFTRLVWISGPTTDLHTQVRLKAFDDYLRDHPLVRGSVHPGDYTPDHAFSVLDEVLGNGDEPVGLLVDGDYVAACVRGWLSERGIATARAGLVGWDDSYFCSGANPPITAIEHHVDGLGRQLGRALVALTDGTVSTHLEGPPAELLVRD